MTKGSLKFRGILCLVMAEAGLLHAQDHFVYPVDEQKVLLQKDILYKSADQVKLHFDLYRLSGERRHDSPVVIIMNGFGDLNSKNVPPQVAWGKTIAADGMTAVTFERHQGATGRDFDDLVSYLKAHSDEYALDMDKLIVMASSGHAFYGLPVITDPARTFIRAAVIYYGYGEVKAFKWNMPVLLVRAGRDNPANDRQIDTLILRAMQHNAPWTIINHHSGTHPFEFGPPDGQSWLVIRETLRFMHRSVSDTLQQAIGRNADLIIAATSLYTGDWPLAVNKYELLVKAEPENSDNFLKLGQAYSGAGSYRQALGAFHQALGLGEQRKRDLSVPASLAAAHLQDAQETLFWPKILFSAPGGREMILHEKDYDFVRQMPGYQQMLKQ